jgi:hypothetical protein
LSTYKYVFIFPNILCQTDKIIVIVNRFTRIFDLLKKSNIDRPKEEVIEKIAKCERLVEAAAFNTSLAYSTYTNVRDSAGSQTKSYIGATLGMRINGSVFEDFPFILSAESNEGKYVLLKMLKISDGPLSLDIRIQDISYEAAACGFVHQAIVPMERRSVSIDPDTARAANCAAGTIDVLVMPWYQCTLNKVPSGNRNRIATEGRKLLSALQYMHSEGFVHLDVKSMNIFISNEGAWYLGDFGSCKPIGQKITSSTFQLYFEEIAFAPAQPKHDFFMFLMLLLIEGLDNRCDYNRLFYETRSHFADYCKVMVYVREHVTSEDSLYAKLVDEVITLFMDAL